MRVMPFDYLMQSGRMPGLESPSDQGRGTSEASGAWPWRRSGSVRGGGLWSVVDGRRTAPWNSGRDRRCGKADGLRAWAGTAHRSEREMTVERGTTVLANWHCPSNRSTYLTPLKRAEPRSGCRAALGACRQGWQS